MAVVGVGGIGANAIQGAKLAGAKQIWAIDPVEFKREKAMEFGATHTRGVDGRGDAAASGAASWGTMANKVIMTMGVGSGEVMVEALALAAKRGRVVVTNIHPAMEMSASMSLLDLTLMEKQVVGSLFGSGNPRADIPKLLGLYREGQLDLDGLVTNDVHARRRQRRLRRHARGHQHPRRHEVRLIRSRIMMPPVTVNSR